MGGQYDLVDVYVHGRDSSQIERTVIVQFNSIDEAKEMGEVVIF